MTHASETKTSKTAMNGQTDTDQKSGDMVDVNVDVKETVGIIVLGFLFFIVLMSMLRAQKRERKLLEKLAELQNK